MRRSSPSLSRAPHKVQSVSLNSHDLRLPAPSADVGLRAACQAEEFVVCQWKDGLRDAAGSPQLVELGERAVDDRSGWASGDRPERHLRSAGWCARVRTPVRRDGADTPSCSPTLFMSTRCAPLVMINNGAARQRFPWAARACRRSQSWKASKISELAMAPTGHPNCSAAARAVVTASSSRRTRPGQPSGLQNLVHGSAVWVHCSYRPSHGASPGSSKRTRSW